ncbi:hypothetical protein D3C81_1065400 [compost metagenome]
MISFTTFRTAVVWKASNLAVITAVPRVASAGTVISPSALIAARTGLLLVYTTPELPAVISLVVLLEYFATTLSFFVPPGEAAGDSGIISIPVSSGLPSMVRTV